MGGEYRGRGGYLGQVERYGSAGEKQIGRMLTRYGMRYFYEHPVAVVDRGKVRVWYPDFWLPDIGVAIEYNGVSGDDDYAAGIEHKKAVYEATGISCVYLTAESLKGLWPSEVMNEIRENLEGRVRRFDDVMNQRGKEKDEAHLH